MPIRIQFLLFTVSALLSISCSHIVRVRSNHFATPMVNTQPFHGQFFISGSTDSRITVIDDITQNPPLRTSVKINKDYSVRDILFPTDVPSLNLNLAIINKVETFIDGYYLGLKWQFLDSSDEANAWIASIQGASGSLEITDGFSSSASAKSVTRSYYWGASMGYKFNQFITYFSYLREAHKVSTTVNIKDSVSVPGGNFGPYTDTGIHDNLSFGIESKGAGFHYGFEYAMIQMIWNKTSRGYQNNFGLKAGYAW